MFDSLLVYIDFLLWIKLLYFCVFCRIILPPLIIIITFEFHRGSKKTVRLLWNCFGLLMLFNLGMSILIDTVEIAGASMKDKLYNGIQFADMYDNSKFLAVYFHPHSIHSPMGFTSFSHFSFIYALLPKTVVKHIGEYECVCVWFMVFRISFQWKINFFR